MAAISQSPTTAKVPRSQSPTNWNGLVLGIGVVLVLILVGGMALLWFFNGQAVAGEEFCPQTFQLRDFYYRRLPWVKTIVTPTRLNLKPLPVSTSVLQHIKRLPDERWDVAMVNEGVQQDIRAPRILIQALSPSTTSGSFWDSWSNKHPELAAVTWPIVQQAAVLQAYEIVPDILESALDISYSNAPTPDAITNRWKSTLEDLSRKNQAPQ